MDKIKVMIVSELKLFEFLTHELKLSEAKAKEYVAELRESQEKFELKTERHINEKFEDKKATLIAEISAKIAQSEARLTLRMFYFWIGQVAVIAGILTYFFKSYGH